jgi:hypothetical protein
MSRKLVKRAKELMAANAELVESIREVEVGPDYGRRWGKTYLNQYLTQQATMTWDDAVLRAMSEQGYAGKS